MEERKRKIVELLEGIDDWKILVEIFTVVKTYDEILKERKQGN